LKGIGGCDLLVAHGRRFHGKYDLVEQVLSELKRSLFYPVQKFSLEGRWCWFVWRGAPSPALTAECCGTRARAPAPHKKYFFGVARGIRSTIGDLRIVRSDRMIEALAGMTPEPGDLSSSSAEVGNPDEDRLERFLQPVLSGEFENAESGTGPRWQGSGDIAALARANCYCGSSGPRSDRRGEWVSLLMR